TATWQRIVTEFSDQAAAVSEARARLTVGLPSDASAAGRPPGSPASAQIWDTVGDTVSPDGRYITFTDAGTGELALHEIATDLNRTLTGTRRNAAAGQPLSPYTQVSSGIAPNAPT